MSAGLLLEFSIKVLFFVVNVNECDKIFCSLNALYDNSKKNVVSSSNRIKESIRIGVNGMFGVRIGALT